MTSQHYLINGRNDLALSPLDRGFTYGDGVFRTFKIRAGLPINWVLHYTKLVADCTVLGIACPSEAILLRDIKQLFNFESDSVAKIIITRGEGARGYAVPALAQPTRVLYKLFLPDYPSINFDQGVNLHLCELRLSPQPRYAGVKHLNRLENVMARMEWSDLSIADGLLLDTDGNVIECTMSNVFVRFGKLLLTPDLSSCGVAGVTRQSILDIAQRLGLHTEVTQIPLDRLMQADEIIICNSLYGAWQVRTLNNKNWQPLDLATNLRRALQE